MARKFICKDDYPVVSTEFGKLRGFVLDDIFRFYGVEYARARRFHMPVEPESWEGIKDATSYGCTSPTMGNPIPSGEILIPHRFWPENENCQNLNIWTKSIDPDAKKPVIVWYHGGGYADGSSLEQVAYEGDALCEYGDVVVVTVNHRLNILGYFDLSAFGEEYKNSGNAGMADIVSSLKWIRNNIAGFGGDPDNVTIFGQSGGGGKVCTLLQIPEAAGLFHKAIMMSGGAGARSLTDAADPKEFADEMLKLLNLDSVRELETIPYSLLEKAYVRVCNKLQKAIMWRPVPNDYYIGHPVNVGFTEFAKTVPTIVSTVIAEQAGFSPIEPLKDPDEFFQGHGKEAVEAFRKAFPDKDLKFVTKVAQRTDIVKFMEARANSDPSAPGYTYQFALVFDVLDGRPAWHCSDIPFIFHNTARVANANIEGVSDRLEDEMAGALVAFARTGNPNHAGMPEWKPYTKDCHATMIFDRVSRCGIDYDKELNELYRLYTPARVFTPRIPKEEEGGRAWLY